METGTKNRRKLLVPLAWGLLLLLAWGMWLYHLDASDLTFDETATYTVAHRSLVEILTRLRASVREHPPVYYLLIHVWMRAAGAGEFSMRLFSVGAGLVALALTGWLARLALGRRAAAGPLMTALLLAFTPGMAYCVRNARMYSLVLVWATLSAGLFLRDWLPENKWPRRAALFSLAMVHLLALFTHYYLLLFILVQPLVLLVARRWRPLLAWCALHLVPALAGLLWFWLAPGLQATVSSMAHLASSAPLLAQMLSLLDRIIFSPIISTRSHLLYALLASVGGGVLVALWRRRTVGMWLTLTLLLPLTLAYALPQSPAPRYLLPLLPFAALALAFLCLTPFHLIRPRWLAWGTSGGLALATVWLLVAGGLHNAIFYERSNYGRVLATIHAHARPGDALLFYGPWQWLQFHYYDPGGMPPHLALPREAPPHLDPAQAEPELERLITQYERLWVIPAAVNDVDPAHFAGGWLRTHAHPVWDTPYFSLYLPPLPPDAPSRPAEVTFGDALRLESVAWEPEPLREGDALRLTLHWRPLHPLDEDVRLALKLTDATGHIWDSAYPIPGMWACPPSEWQPGQVITDYEGLTIPWGAPPAEYTVSLGVAGASSGRVLSAGEEPDAPLLKLTVGEIPPTPVPAPPLGNLDHRLYLPLVARQTPPRPPVLYGLPHADDAATFRQPDGPVRLSLAGYEPGGVRFQQGYPVPLTLHWLAPQRPLPELDLRLRIVHPTWLGLRSETVLTKTIPLAPTYPAPLWSSGRLVTLPTALMLPPDAPTGRAWVTLEVLGEDGVPWQTERGGALPLFEITVEGRPVLRRMPNGLTPAQVDFGDEIGLRGYRVEGEARPGGALHVTYAWYARTRPSTIYAVFNHLVAADGSMVSQADGWPQGGRVLTTQWQPGEYVEDDYTLTIPPDAPPGPYTLYVGLYDAASGERQPALMDGQRLPADQLSIPLPQEER